MKGGASIPAIAIVTPVSVFSSLAAQRLCYRLAACVSVRHSQRMLATLRCVGGGPPPLLMPANVVAEPLLCPLALKDMKDDPPRGSFPLIFVAPDLWKLSASAAALVPCPSSQWIGAFLACCIAFYNYVCHKVAHD